MSFYGNSSEIDLSDLLPAPTITWNISPDDHSVPAFFFHVQITIVKVLLQALIEPYKIAFIQILISFFSFNESKRPLIECGAFNHNRHAGKCLIMASRLTTQMQTPASKCCFLTSH